MKRIIIFLIISMPILMLSCSEDWLEPEPRSLFVPENVYIDEAGFKSLLVTIRRDMRHERAGNQNEQKCLYEMTSSDYGVEMRRPDFTGNVVPSSSNAYIWIFSRIYGYIKNTNVLLSRIDNIEWTNQEIRNKLVAEALFYRSYWYYRLVMSYGDVPWIGDELTGAKLDFYSHSRWAIIDKIQKDMEYAVQHLAETAPIDGVSKFAGHHLLTKIYLANTEFDKAIASASEIIDGPFALMTERFGLDADKPWRNVMWDLHRGPNVNSPENTETIFSTVDRPDAPAEARTRGCYLSRLYIANWSGLPDSQGRASGNNASVQADSIGQGGAYLHPSHWSKYPLWNEFGFTWENTPDMRRGSNSWLEVYDIINSIPTSVDFGKPLTTEYLAAKHDTSVFWYAFPYYKTHTPAAYGKDNGLPRGGNKDLYIYRLAETYLLRAEAYYWKDQFGPAASDINKVRSRANAVEISSGDVSIDYIFDERARELYLEEPRHSELVRVSNIMAKLNLNGYSLNNLHEKNWFYDRVMAVNDQYQEPLYHFRGGPPARISPYNIYWPIPRNVITANTLGVINQNLGYLGAEQNVPPLETIEENKEE